MTGIRGLDSFTSSACGRPHPSLSLPLPPLTFNYVFNCHYWSSDFLPSFRVSVVVFLFSSFLLVSCCVALFPVLSIFLVLISFRSDLTFHHLDFFSPSSPFANLFFFITSFFLFFFFYLSFQISSSFLNLSFQLFSFFSCPSHFFLPILQSILKYHYIIFLFSFPNIINHLLKSKQPSQKFFIFPNFQAPLSHIFPTLLS